MTSWCLIPILVGVWRGHSSISRSSNGVLIYRCNIHHLMDISYSSSSSFHLKFSHHILALWSEAHLVSYWSIWGIFSCSSIFYSDVNYMISLFINLLGLQAKKYHVLLINNKETMPFPHLLVVNSYNIDRFEWLCKILMIYEWMEFN